MIEMSQLVLPCVLNSICDCCRVYLMYSYMIDFSFCWHVKYRRKIWAKLKSHVKLTSTRTNYCGGVAFQIYANYYCLNNASNLMHLI